MCEFLSEPTYHAFVTVIIFVVPCAYQKCSLFAIIAFFTIVAVVVAMTPSMSDDWLLTAVVPLCYCTMLEAGASCIGELQAFWRTPLFAVENAIMQIPLWLLYLCLHCCYKMVLLQYAAGWSIPYR